MLYRGINFQKGGLITKSVYVLIIRIIGVALFFGLSLFLTNFFDAKNVGEYDFSKSIISLLGSVCLLGMNESIIYYSGLLRGNSQLYVLKKVYLKMIRIMLIISIFLFLITFLAPPSFYDHFFGSRGVSKTIYKTVGTLFFYGIVILNIDTLRGLGKIILSELLRNVFRFGIFFILILVFWSRNQEFKIVDIFLGNFLILALLSTLFLAKAFKHIGLTTSENAITLKNIILRSYPMSISVISLLLMQSVDVIILKKHYNFDTVAHYAIAIKITTVISLVLSSVNAVFAPRIAELFTQNQKDQLRQALKTSVRLIFILTMPIIIGLIFFSEFVLNLFGKQYLIASTPLIILLVGQSINALCGSVGMYYNMTGKQKIFQKILVSAFLINIILNILLIPRYGMSGAAFATCFSLLFWNIFGAIQIYKKEKIKTFIN